MRRGGPRLSGLLDDDDVIVGIVDEFGGRCINCSWI
jgi:hypothetical protein